MRRCAAFIGIMTAFVVLGCDAEVPPTQVPLTPAVAAPADAKATVPTRAEDVSPLEKGSRAPVAKLRDPAGEPVDLAEVYASQPSVLIFYRGGWCPYCNTHLGQIAETEPELLKLGYQVLAISPDRPEELAASIENQSLKYRLLSDSDMALSKAFGLAFRVDDQTIEQYRGYGIDLEKVSGRDHHLLPVPAVYIVDRAGVIQFASWNHDYTKRVEPAALLDAARTVAAAAGG